MLSSVLVALMASSSLKYYVQNKNQCSENSTHYYIAVKNHYYRDV